MGKYNKPISIKCWEKFLTSQNCHFVRIRGSHHNWKCPNCSRTIIFRGSKKEIPRFHINTNLKTMGISIKDFNEWIDKNC